MEIEYELEKRLSEAVSYLEERDTEKAENAFARILKDFPDALPAWLANGEFYLALGSPVKAVQILKKAVKMAPEEGMASFLLGVALTKRACFRLGLKCLENADKLMPNTSEIKRQIGFSKIMLNKTKEGNNMLRRAIKIDPTNALAYADLAMSYIKACDYKEAIYCLETAKGLAPGDEFILINLKEAKASQRRFNKLSPKQKERRLKEAGNPKYNKQLRIEFLMAGLQDSSGLVEDLKDVTEELKLEGLSGQIAMFHDPKTPEERAAIKYISAHKKIKNLNKELTKKEMEFYGNRLLDKKTSIKEKEESLVILAHQGHKKALEILEEYNKNPNPSLKIWARMALDECRTFSEEGDYPVIQIHKINE